MAFPYVLTAFSSSLQAINPFSTPPNSPAFDPTIADVLVVKAILQSLSLPLELADTIIDDAEYWPHTSAVLPGIYPVCAQGQSHENYFVVCPPHFAICSPLTFQDPHPPSRMSSKLPFHRPQPCASSSKPGQNETASLLAHSVRGLENSNRRPIFSVGADLTAA